MLVDEDACPVLFREGLSPLEARLAEVPVVYGGGGVAGAPCDARELSDLVYPAREVDGDDLLEGPGAAWSAVAGEEGVVDRPAGDECEGSEEPLRDIEGLERLAGEGHVLLVRVLALAPTHGGRGLCQRMAGEHWCVQGREKIRRRFDDASPVTVLWPVLSQAESSRRSGSPAFSHRAFAGLAVAGAPWPRCLRLGQSISRSSPPPSTAPDPRRPIPPPPSPSTRKCASRASNRGQQHRATSQPMQRHDPQQEA